MRSQLIAWAIGLVLLLLPSAAFAQEPRPDADAPPITVVFVEGRVETARASGIQPAQAPDLLGDDDRLVTADGRAELAYGDGSLVHIDRDTDMRVDSAGRLRLVRGRVVVHTPRDSDAVEIATPAGLVRMEPDGEYDLSARDLDGDAVIAAIHGRAVFEDGDREIPIAADDELRLDPRDRQPRWARVGPPDVFRHWAASRVAATTRAAREHGLPAALAAYASQFAEHGQWTAMAPYGPVWVPSAPVGWRPYLNGSWRFTRYGWTWIDSDPWAWPVHHFGRWGRHEARGWFWIPQRTWGPAWVGWAIAADHVGWSPLGWDARPVVDFFVGTRLGPIDIWASSWSILPRHAFGARGPVFGHLEDPRRLPGPVLGGFVSQMIGPRGPAGYGDYFAARPGRRSWQAPTPSARDREWSAPARRDVPGSFGSAAPSRAVAPESRRDDAYRSRRPADPRPSDARPGDARARDGTYDEVRPGDARSGVARPGTARPGTTRPNDAPVQQTAPVMPTYRDNPEGGYRRPNAIRPRYEPPATSSSSPPPDAAPAPVTPSAPRERGSGDGVQDRRRGGSGVERSDAPRSGPEGGGSAGSGSETRGGSNSGDGNRRRPR